MDEYILNRSTMVRDQEILITRYLESIWEGKDESTIKYPKVEQLRYELSFNDLFVERLYQEALENKENNGDIYIHTGKSGVRRIYDSESYILLKSACNFYDFLKFKWQETVSPRLIDIWEEYHMIEDFSQDTFLEIIRLLSRKSLILLFNDEEGRVIVERHGYSQKTFRRIKRLDLLIYEDH